MYQYTQETIPIGKIVERFEELEKEGWQFRIVLGRILANELSDEDQVVIQFRKRL